MYPNRKLAFLFPVLLMACSADVHDAAPDGGSASGDAGTDAGGEPEYAATKARLKFIGGPRYAERLSQGLGVETETLCNELGRFSCVSLHNIALGGVEPYDKNVLSPLPEPATTSPIAVERIALSACAEAVRQDRQSAGPLSLANFTSEARARATQHLYRGLVLRNPSATEVAELEVFADEVSDPQTWAVAACVAVATSLEVLFY